MLLLLKDPTRGHELKVNALHDMIKGQGHPKVIIS